MSFVPLFWFFFLRSFLVQWMRDYFKLTSSVNVFLWLRHAYTLSSVVWFTLFVSSSPDVRMKCQLDKNKRFSRVDRHVWVTLLSSVHSVSLVTNTNITPNNSPASKLLDLFRSFALPVSKLHILRFKALHPLFPAEAIYVRETRQLWRN